MNSTELLRVAQFLLNMSLIFVVMLHFSYSTEDYSGKYKSWRWSTTFFALVVTCIVAAIGFFVVAVKVRFF